LCRPMSTKTNQPRFPAQDMTVFGSGEHKLSWSSKQQEGSKADFLWSDLPEPHAERKKIIVDEFKEKVSSLNGPTWKTKYVVLFTVSLHLTFAYLLRDMAWTTWEFWLVSFNATVQCDGSCLVVGKKECLSGSYLPTCDSVYFLSNACSSSFHLSRSPDLLRCGCNLDTELFSGHS
jgi:hypothetical protein